MKRQWSILLTLILSSHIHAQTTGTYRNYDGSWGTIWINDPNRFNDPAPYQGPSVLEVLLEHSQKSDELEWKKKVAAQQDASRKAAAKRASESAKLTAEMVTKCQKQAEQIYDMYDKLKGLNAWDDQSLAFRKKIGDLIADDPWQAFLTLFELREKMKVAVAEEEQKRQNEEYQKALEANRPKGIGERVKNAYNALFPPKPQISQTAQQLPTQLPIPADNFGFVPDPVQPSSK